MADTMERSHFAHRRGGARLAMVLMGLAVLAGCYDQVVVPDVEDDGRIVITNDEDSLSSRVTYPDEEIPLDRQPERLVAAGPAGAPGAGGPQRAPSSVRLTLVAQVRPPTVGGTTVQATSISRRTAWGFLVSYNTRGSVFRGGVDYMINWFDRFPRLSSSAKFRDSDVSAVALSGSSIFAAEATDASGFASPAAVERIGLGWFGLDISDNGRHDVSSFAATSALAADYLYVTTGSNGHVYALDPGTLAVVGQYALDDARWVARDPATGNIVVAQGTPGRISVFRGGSFPGGSMQLLNTFSFPGADVAESKTTVEVVGGKAFIAAGSAGVQIMCLDDGSIVGSVPRPDPASLGLSPSVVVTNAVSVEGDLMFISNGEAGVYVAAGEQAFADTPCNAQQNVTVLGHLQFGSQESVNHVDYNNGVLLVAAGLGGVKVVRVRTN